MNAHELAGDDTVSYDTDLTGLHADSYKMLRDPWRWSDEVHHRIEGNFIKECCSILASVKGHPEGVLGLPNGNAYSWLTLPSRGGWRGCSEG